MRIASLFALLVFAGCVDPSPESCDLDPLFSDSKQNVFCLEEAAGSGVFTCTCPDDSTFQSSDTCRKTDIEQGELIDTACPVAQSDN